MNWMIPDLDVYITYFVKELMRWSGDNVLTLLVITNFLALLKVLAYRTKAVWDDKIVSLLIYFFSFRWVKSLTAGTKENPVVLKNEVK